MRVDGHVPVPEPIELDLSVVLLGLDGVGERGTEKGFEWSVDGGDIERGRRKGQRREENIGQNTSIWATRVLKTSTLAPRFPPTQLSRTLTLSSGTMGTSNSCHWSGTSSAPSVGESRLQTRAKRNARANKKGEDAEPAMLDVKGVVSCVL